MATPFVLSPYFNTVPPENWNKADFVEAGNDMCFWCSSLAHIEESNENYSPVQRARAQTILNEDAYETFFARHPPHEWDMRRFIMFTKRPQAWAWAVDRGLGDSSLKSADAKAALLRCQEQKASPLFFLFFLPLPCMTHLFIPATHHKPAHCFAKNRKSPLFLVSSPTFPKLSQIHFSPLSTLHYFCLCPPYARLCPPFLYPSPAWIRSFFPHLASRQCRSASETLHPR